MMKAVRGCWIWLLCAGLLITGGCSSPELGDRKHAAASGSGDSPMNIRFMYPLYGKEPRKTEVWEWIEEKFNITYEPMAIPINSYLNRLKAAVASPNPPDALVWTSFPQADLFHLIQSGMFHQLDDLLPQYANLGEIPREIWNNVKVDGKIYGVPRPRALVDQAVIIRKDWLDALGLPLPETLEDYRRAAIMFTHNDPDGNGKADTYGFAAGEGLDFLHELKYAFGAGNGWTEQPDGSLLASIISSEHEAYLRWLRELYANGGIDPSFAVLQPTEVWERFKEGKTGIIITEISNYAHFIEELSVSDPDSELMLLGPPVGPDGHAGFQQKIGFYGAIFIPKVVPMEKAERILSFIDWQAGEEGTHMKLYGLEGIHHRIGDNGDVIFDRARFREEGINWLFAMNKYSPYLYVSYDAPPDVQAEQRRMLDLVKDKGVANPVERYLSDAQLDIGSIYKKTIRNFQSEFVRGEQPDDVLDAWRSEWLMRGGQQATDELNALYKADRSKEEGAHE